MGKKSKFDKSFVREELSKITIRENVSVYDELMDKENLNNKVLTIIENHLRKNTGKRFKEAEFLTRQYDDVRNKFEKLRTWQTKRRNKCLDWFMKYMRLLEAREHKFFREKHRIIEEIPCLAEVLFDTEYSEEQLLFLNNVEQIVKQEQEKNIGEKTETEVNVEPVIVEDNSSEEEPEEKSEEETEESEEGSSEEISANDEEETAEVEEVDKVEEKADAKKEEAGEPEKEEKPEQNAVTKIKSILIAKENG